MSEINEVLAEWFEELQKLPPDAHLLCPRISFEDPEDYKDLTDQDTEISVEEKKKRIQDGEKRIEITYWNSLIFGFDKEAAGKWLEDFTTRIEGCLKSCSDCVLNWHMKRRVYLAKFAEKWNEEDVDSIRLLLDRLDVSRIDHNLIWAKHFIEKIEATGTVFKKSAFGEHSPEVHIAVYEALCCVPYMAIPEQRTTFQYVFMRLQGKTYLKLGTKDPLPGMTYFLFDQKNDDRRRWAHENWKNIDDSSLTDEQFEWAISGGLIAAIEDISRKDLANPIAEIYTEIERFWMGFEKVLRVVSEKLILGRFRTLELRPGSCNVYDLLFRHIQFCRNEAVLVVSIRVLICFLQKAPKAIWDVVGDARPNVIADLVCGSPAYHSLLLQSLEDCWSGPGTGPDEVPFPTSWVDPWLQSLGRDRRYDACDGLLHTLFETLATNPNIGEPGQAACIRAGFDALTTTLKTFSELKEVGSGTTHLYANGTFNVFMKHRDLILQNLQRTGDEKEHVGWKRFQIAKAATNAINTAMKLDMNLFSQEYLALRKGNRLQSAITRDSVMFWEGVKEMFDMFSQSQQATLAEGFLLALEPLIGLEQIRPLKKDNKLDDSSKFFNKSYTSTTDILAKIFGRISELDTMDLNTLFENNSAFQVAIGISLHGDSDMAEGASEILKSWTGELSRGDAFQQISQLHSDQTLGFFVFIFGKVMGPEGPKPAWDPIRPILHMSRDVLRGLTDRTSGVLRVQNLSPKSVAILLRWWTDQWAFVSLACRNIEHWSFYISNSVMTEFCREIMELAEALIAEDGLFASAIAASRNRSEKETMAQILVSPRKHFKGVENMIRLKDRWLVDVTVRVLCKILTRLRENNLEIAQEPRQLILDACIPQASGRYVKSTNLTDQQRAELLQSLGHTEDEVQVIQIAPVQTKDQIKKQSKLDAWSKSGSSTAVADSKSNRDDVLQLSKSIDNPILRQLEAKSAVDKAKALAKAKAKAQAAKVPDVKAISALKETRKREKEEKAKRDALAIARAKALRGETVAGEGSGLAGLAILGKDHSRSEIMVNSSDEESEEEDDSDSDNQLAALSTGGQKMLTEAEKRNRQILRDKARGPVKKIKQKRSVKEMRARVTPPMDRLHNTILAWDLFHQGNDPPSGPKANEVATKYMDPRSYQDTFFPLLASEAWQSFVTSKDEITSQPFGMKIASRASVDSFLEVTYTMPLIPGKDRGVSEADILLVSLTSNPLNDPEAKHCLARVHRITVKKGVIEITYRVASRNNQMAAMLNPGTEVYGVKITNMTTIEREYAALESLQYYDLMDEILKAEPSPIIRYGDEKIAKWQENWTLNRGQAMAVLGAYDNDGFTLIQGPPGTGKTKTIVAMVGALLSEQLSIPLSGTPMGMSRPTATSQGNQTTPKKLLVCAPSNAAVDELVLRMMNGIKSVSGKTHKINVLRLGRSDAINAAVKEVTLDEMVKNRLESDGTRDKAVADRNKLHDDAAKIKDELAQLRPQLEAARLGDRAVYSNLQRHFEDLKRQQMQIGKQIDANKDSGNSIARETELRRRQIQQEILGSAHVLCATLSGSGHEMFKNLDVEFETVIIDEAAQCVELSALIPLKYGCCKCILVGDPKQLPPTVLSQSASRFGYDQSLFVRMQQNHPKSVHLLDMQYRMHPEISSFPSKEFYEGQLKDGQDMQRLRQQPWHASSLLGPYRFFDVQGVQEKGNKGRSLVNTRELEVALQLYDRFTKDYQNVDLTRKIGIITPYKAQLYELRNRFIARHGERITDMIEFNTTDAFQGRECEIIIFSCVRASPTGGIGFMTDIRRMNVGLTRAKSSLWILGDSRALVQGEFWKKLIVDAQARNCYTSGDILSMFRKPLDKDGKMPQRGGTASQQYVAHKQSLPIQPVTATSKPGNVAPGQQDGIPGLGSVNNASPLTAASGGQPVIHSSSGKPQTKKRPLDGQDGGHTITKRIASSTDGQRNAMMGKFGNKNLPKPKPPLPPSSSTAKPPTDPSAMAVLGMVPPERPPAVPSQPYPSGPGNNNTAMPKMGSKPAGGENGGYVNRPPPPPGLRKKPKTSMFVPKKR